MELSRQDQVAGLPAGQAGERDLRTERFSRTGLLLGSAFACLGVAFGAFAAHGLRSMLGREMLEVFETGVRYQVYHAFALIVAGLMIRLSAGSLRTIRYAIGFFLAGVILFCGSLYALALTGYTWWGYFTPFGGLAFMGGWVSLFISVLRGDAIVQTIGTSPSARP